jgi:hypothetical protein
MNTRESIFEVQWTSQTSGSWMWMMFHRNAYVPGDSFSWAKWCTPSRNLTKAYDAEGARMRRSSTTNAVGRTTIRATNTLSCTSSRPT